MSAASFKQSSSMAARSTLIAKLNPLRFFQGIAEAQAVAFTTTSSSGTCR